MFANGLHPGVAPSGDALRKDPRTPVRSGDLGRGLYRRNAPAQQRHAHLQPAGVSRGQGFTVQGDAYSLGVMIFFHESKTKRRTR